LIVITNKNGEIHIQVFGVVVCLLFLNLCWFRAK